MHLPVYVNDIEYSKGESMTVGFDDDGNLQLTYDVSVLHRGGRVFHLGSGSAAVSRLYEIAEAGIPGATKIEYLPWGYNVFVTLNGESLLRLIEEHYPDREEKASRIIIPDEEYIIDCYDMS